MPSVSLCVRVVFRGSRPSYDWVDFNSARFGVPGWWVEHRVNGVDGLVVAQEDGTWVASWLCDGRMPPQYPAGGLDEALRHLHAAGESIEQAWERENAPAVQTAGAPAPLCPGCGIALKMSIMPRSMGFVRSDLWSCSGCGYAQQNNYTDRWKGEW